MSKYNNVNPGQYKVSGRERPNTIAGVRQKEVRSEVARLPAKKDKRQPKKRAR